MFFFFAPPPPPPSNDLVLVNTQGLRSNALLLCACFVKKICLKAWQGAMEEMFFMFRI
jgi:hypothetical protein